MKIISATVVQQRHGADIVSLRTDLPEACHPYKEPLCLEFRCAKGGGVLYLVTHFPDIVIEHIARESPDEVPFTRSEKDSGLCCMAAHANAVPPWTCDCHCHVQDDQP